MEKLINKFMDKHPAIVASYAADSYTDTHDINVFQFAECATQERFKMNEMELIDLLEGGTHSKQSTYCQNLIDKLFDALDEVRNSHA